MKPARQPPEPHEGSVRLRSWAAVLLTLLAIFAVFSLLAVIGAGQAAREERVLGLLDKPFDWLRSHSETLFVWSIANAEMIARAVAAVAAVLALVALVVGRGRAVPVILLGAAAALATWGQMSLLADRIALGVGLYAAGFAAAAALGVWCPMGSLPGFPSFPRRLGKEERAATEDAGDSRAAGGRHLRLECGLVFLLAVVGMLLRLYALTEFPASFDIEGIELTILSRTFHGLGEYSSWGLLTTSNGIAHYPVQMAAFSIFGPSVYSVRLAAAFFGLVNILLFYVLVRQLAGPWAAAAAAVLFITGPEQLFWSRSETTLFVSVTTLSLITGNLGVWMVHRLRWTGVLASALWMPFGRLFYAPGLIMFLYPLALYGHALLFTRRALRTLLYAVPALALGLALWFYSLSIVSSAASGWKWKYVSAVTLSGSPAWTLQGELRDASLVDLIRLQLVKIATNLLAVMTSATYHSGFTQWYQRYDPSSHPTMLNVGFVVMAVLGLGYLLGQIYDRRAWAVLVWVVLGLLPGIMSLEPADRRIALAFPALHASAGIMLAAAVRLVRARAGRVLALIAGAGLALAVAAVGSTSLASQFLQTMHTSPVEQMLRFAKPILEESDIVFHNFEPTVALAMAFSNLDRFVKAPVPPCLRAVGPLDWLNTALNPRCDFAGPLYRDTMSEERIAAARAAYRPRRVSFLASDLSKGQSVVDLLKELYPKGRWRRHTSVAGSLSVTALTVDVDDIAALHSPTLQATAGEAEIQTLRRGLLQDLTLHSSSGPADGDAGLMVRAGLTMAKDGWYRFRLEPACESAEARIDDRPVVEGTALPLLAGVHAFELRLPSAATCRLPIRIMSRAEGEAEDVAVGAERFTRPDVARLENAQPRPAAIYEGYGAATLLVPAGSRGEPRDFGVDGEGRLTVLFREPKGWHIDRLAGDGSVQSTWQTVLNGPFQSLEVGADGSLLLTDGDGVTIRDRSGAEIARWPETLAYTPGGLALLGSGEVLSCVPHEFSLLLIDRNGKVEKRWNRFEGGAGRFDLPMSVTAGRDGDLLVIQSDGLALLFRNQDGGFDPRFERSMRFDFSQLPVRPEGCVFDGSDRIVVADPFNGAAMVYDRQGRRLFASSFERDLGGKKLGEVDKFVATADRLYVLNRRGEIWALAR